MPSDWTDEYYLTLLEIKDALANTIVLVHPNFIKPILLSSDASLDGLGAILSQVQGDETVVRPVAFASKSLTQFWWNNPSHRLEFLTLK